MANLNSGKEWSMMDDFDLQNEMKWGRSIEEIACFLCRDKEEIVPRLKELGLWSEDVP